MRKKKFDFSIPYNDLSYEEIEEIKKEINDILVKRDNAELNHDQSVHKLLLVVIEHTMEHITDWM